MDLHRKCCFPEGEDQVADAIRDYDLRSTG